MTQRSQSTNRTLTLLQIMTALLALAGLVIAVYLASLGCTALSDSTPEGALRWPAIFGLLAEAAIVVCCMTALVAFFRMLGRLRKHSAFNVANERALGRMAASCGIAGAVCLAGPLCFMGIMRGILMRHPHVLFGSLDLTGCDHFILPYVWVELLGFLLVSVGAICWALMLLMRRAKELQDENDTIV